MEIFYVGGCDIFLLFFMFDEEVQILYRIYYQGEEGLKKFLIERNLRFVVYIVKRFENIKVNFEDFVLIGIIGLIKVINIYNLNKNIKFVIYVLKCIENEILMFLR